MNQKDTLTPYIESQLKAGVSTEAILGQLVANGWTPEVVSETIAGLTQAPQPIAAAAPVLPTQPQPTLNGTESQQAALADQAQPQVVTGVSQTGSEGYGVLAAIKDAFAAIKANVTSVSIMMVIGFLSTLLGMVAVIFILVAFVFAAGASGMAQGWSATSIFPLLLLTALITVLIGALPTAFTMSVVGIGINDGAEGKKSKIVPTIVAGAKRMPRVLLAIVMSAAISMIPAIVAMVLIFLLSALLPNLSLLFFLLALVAVIAGPLLMIRLLIMPIVALFEDIPMSGLYSRTRHLMRDGGSGFVLKFLGLFFAVAIVLTVVLPSESEIDQASTLTSYAVGIVGAVFYMIFGAVLVMFYRNRKAVRG